jgi:hypothetical protein
MSAANNEIDAVSPNRAPRDVIRRAIAKLPGGVEGNPTAQAYSL